MCLYRRGSLFLDSGEFASANAAVEQLMGFGAAFLPRPAAVL